MGYEISIRRHANVMIALSEWESAVGATEGVRLRNEDTSITNPKTGEIICIPNSRGDAEIFVPEMDKWTWAFRWRSSSGDITFPLTADCSNPRSALMRIARRLALQLGAQLICDGGKVFE